MSTIPLIGATNDSFPYQTPDGTFVISIDTNIQYLHVLQVSNNSYAT